MIFVTLLLLLHLVSTYFLEETRPKVPDTDEQDATEENDASAVLKGRSFTTGLLSEVFTADISQGASFCNRKNIYICQVDVSLSRSLDDSAGDFKSSLNLVRMDQSYRSNQT